MYQIKEYNKKITEKDYNYKWNEGYLSKNITVFEASWVWWISQHYFGWSDNVSYISGRGTWGILHSVYTL